MWLCTYSDPRPTTATLYRANSLILFLMHRYASTMSWKNTSLCVQHGESLGNHADTNTYLSRHLAASLVRLIHIFPSLSLCLKNKRRKKKKEKFFFKSQSRSIYVNNKIYIEFCAFLLKSWVKTLVSLLNKLLANFPQEQLRRIQIVC